MSMWTSCCGWSLLTCGNTSQQVHLGLLCSNKLALNAMIFPFLQCCFHNIPHLRLLHSRSYKQVHRLFPFQSQSLVLHRISLSFLIGLIYMLMPHEFITLFYLIHHSFHVGNADLCCSFEGPLLYHMSQLTRL